MTAKIRNRVTNRFPARFINVLPDKQVIGVISQYHQADYRIKNAC